MLKDILETPKVIETLLKKHLPENQKVQELNIDVNIKNLSRIIIVASGSSRNAANTASPFIEYISGIPVIVEFASEFAQKEPIISDKELIILVSQSGETGDVISSLKVAKEKNAKTFAITNKKNSTVDKNCHSSMLVLAGEEESVPATKTFTAQLFCLYTLGLYFAEQKKYLPDEKTTEIKTQLKKLPELLKENINNSEEVCPCAKIIKDSKGIIILGKCETYGLAEETSLKIKETSYINAAGYPTGEFLHGHLALLDEDFSLISLILPTLKGQKNFEIAKKNTQEIFEKRKPKTIIIKRNSDKIDFDKNSNFINISGKDVFLQPFEVAIKIQLLTYEIAKLLGHDVKNPRSLSKTVSGE